MKIGIAGLGLIGGSIGLALREPGHQIVGYDPDPEHAELALGRFCVDRLGSLAEVAESDVVFVAAPPRFVVQTLNELSRLKRPESIFTDCTSVKMPVTEWAESMKASMFVPGHPMAGHERSGPGFASAWLFRNARWLIGPLAFTDPRAVATVEDLVRTMGATPVRIAAASHDRHMAVVSHLPHALAALLVQIGESLDRQDVGGGSWRDVTRVGGVDPDLWTQIFLGNRLELSAALTQIAGDLTTLSRHLDEANETAIRELFVAAVKAKSKPSNESNETPATGSTKSPRGSRSTLGVKRSSRKTDSGL